MIRVDNLGAGNCMYYAYAISLVHSLRLDKNKKLAPEIFQRLNLTRDESVQLLDIINNQSLRSNKIISDSELITIQNILGPALRNFAADSVFENFKVSPMSSSILPAAIFLIRKTIAAISPKLCRYIDPSSLTETQGNFTQAELFKTPDMTDCMLEFTSQIQETLEEQFNQRIQEQRIESKKTKMAILEALISDASQLFFLANDSSNLKEYIKHLKTDRVWGSEETLMSMHSALTGERQVRKSDGKISIEKDFYLFLEIYQNGRPTNVLTFSKLILEQAPNHIDYNELLKLLEYKPGYILHQNHLYYIGIEDKPYIVKGPAIEEIRGHQSINWHSGSSCSALELFILSKSIHPRPKDEHYLRENYYAIVLNNENNMHWTSFIPQSYQPTLENRCHWSLFKTGFAGLAVGEILFLSLPKFFDNIQQFLGLSHLATHLAVLASVALIFAIVAHVLNTFGYSPPKWTCDLLSAERTKSSQFEEKTHYHRILQA